MQKIAGIHDQVLMGVSLPAHTFREKLWSRESSTPISAADCTMDMSLQPFCQVESMICLLR